MDDMSSFEYNPTKASGTVRQLCRDGEQVTFDLDQPGAGNPTLHLSIPAGTPGADVLGNGIEAILHWTDGAREQVRIVRQP
jgi:hypothetical protein